MTESLFANWCALNGVQPVPMPPHIVARFVADIAPFGIHKVWEAVQEVSRAHHTIGLADPTLAPAVTTIVSEIANVTPPRSWNKDWKQRFRTLPYDVQVYIDQREYDREGTISRAFSERDKARSELEKLKNEDGEKH